MQLTASTVAAILAFTVAKAGALPSPQQPTTTDSVAATQTPAAPAAPVASEAGPVYDPEEVFYVEKRWTPSAHKWQGGDHHPYQGQHGGPGGMGFHGPMADSEEYEEYGDDDADDHDHDVQASRLARRAINLDFSPEEHEHEHDDSRPLNRRAINMKQYKWYQYQTGKKFMDMVGGNPNIRNLNFRDQSRTLGMGLRRRDVAPRSSPQTHKNQLPYPMARPLVPTRYRDPVGRGGFGPMPDDVEDGDYYYYPHGGEN